MPVLANGVELPSNLKPSTIPQQTQQADIPNRLTVVDRIYYQEIGQPIYDLETKYAVQLQSKNHQVYEKRMRAGEQWKPLNIQWEDMDGNPITQCSELIIRNEEGVFQHTIPTEEEKQEARERVLEIALERSLQDGEIVEPILIVAPGTVMRCQPFALNGFQVRCRKGTARFTLILIPA